MLNRTPRSLQQTTLADRNLIGPLFDLQRQRKSFINYKNKARQVALSFLVRDIIPPDEDKKTKLGAAYTRAGHILDRHINEGKQEPDDEKIVALRRSYLDIVKLSLEPVLERRLQIEDEMKALASKLPAMEFVRDVPGVDALGLAVIVAEAGDLSRYPTVQHLWKRFELDSYDGHARSSWRRGGRGPGWAPVALSSKTWEELGAAPRKLGQLFGVVTEALAKAKAKSKYGEIYSDRRKRTMVTHPEWGEGKPLNKSGFPSSRHADMDAKRVMTKAFLKDLWVFWRDTHGLIGFDPARYKTVEQHQADARARRGAQPVTPTSVRPRAAKSRAKAAV